MADEDEDEDPYATVPDQFAAPRSARAALLARVAPARTQSLALSNALATT